MDLEQQPLLGKKGRRHRTRSITYILCFIFPLTLHLLFPYLISRLLRFNGNLVTFSTGVAVLFPTFIDQVGRLLLDIIARDIDEYIHRQAFDVDLSHIEKNMVEKSECPVKCLKIIVLKGLPTLFSMTNALCLAGIHWYWAIGCVALVLLVGLVVRDVTNKGFGSAKAVCKSKAARDLKLYVNPLVTIVSY